MKIGNKLRIKILSLARGVDQMPVYKELLDNQFTTNRQEIEEYWKEKSFEIAKYHFNNNPVYREFLLSNGISSLEGISFQEIPIIDKAPLRASDSIHEEQAKAFYNSGGTSGTPFSYALSSNALGHLWPNLWRAFNVAGYLPGDKLVMIAAPSLFDNRSLKRRVYDFVSNFEILSAFDLNEKKLNILYDTIKRDKINYIYGYTSAILLFLNYLKKEGLYLELKGIFTTSETIIPSVYGLAKKYCSCEVYDIYGANDGGILAFECGAHNGYHISSERTYVELVDNKIVLTDLLNTAFPFVRYEVGDLSSSNSLIKEKCSCGSALFRLKDISGRLHHYIEDLDGNKVHSEFFNHVLRSEQAISQIQIINEKDQVVVNIIPADNSFTQQFFDQRYLDILQKRFKKKLKIELNLPIEKLKNQKTPTLINR